MMKLNLEIDKKFREVETIINFLKVICDEKYGKINTKVKSKLIDIQNLLEENLEDSNFYLQSLSNQIDNLSKIKEDFITNVNHQIRIPLTIVKGTLDFLEESIYDLKKSDILNRIHRLKSSIEDLSKLVYELLDTSNFENNKMTAKLEQIDLKLLILDLIKHYKGKFLEKELDIQLNFPKYDIFILNDSLHIRKVLSVIIENAFIYTEKGFIHIQYDFNPKDKHQIVIEIKDSGIGISNTDTQKLFKLFTRGRIHSKEGLGLGLYIAYKFTELHGGKIEIKSVHKQGSSFKIFLPLHSKYT